MYKNVKLFLLVCLVISTTTLFAQPSNMEAGKCYAKCTIPAEYSTVEERMETQPAYKKMLIAQPAFETVREEVMITPASVRLVAIPAEYSTTEEKMMIKEASKKYVVSAAEYETSTERVMVAEESSRLIPLLGEFRTIENSEFYYSNADGSGLSAEYGDLMDPNNPNNPNNPDSPFNPNNPNSPYNPNNPDSPLNPSSPYNPNNPDGLWNPNNPNSPFHPDNAGNKIPDDFLIKSQVGSIMPYLTDESSISVERVPMEYENSSEEVEITPVSYRWEQRTTENCTSPDGDCAVMCYVEVPAVYQTVTKSVAKGCAAGYFLSGKTADGREECAKVVYKAAAYGPRSIFTQAPSFRAEVIPAKYENIKVRKVVKEASLETIDVPAEFEMVQKRVVSKAATTRYEYVPAKYKTVSRKMRKGLKRLGYVDPTGTLISYPNGATPNKSYPAVINPATGFPIANIPNNGLPSSDDPFKVDPNTGMPVGNPIDPASLNPYYTAGCPSGLVFDPRDGLCKNIVEVPAEYTNVTKTMVSKTAQTTTEWTEVVCPTKANPATIRAVQRALNSRGYNAGVADGVMGSRTKAALAKFQEDNNLPIGGMNLPTMRKLGIDF